MYLVREIEQTVLSYLKQFKVVLVTGPRQIGKTTMLKHALPSKYANYSLDDLDLLNRIKDDSSLFFLENEPPLMIDEIQYAPELFMRIKSVVDQSPEKGVVVLTGSQTFHLMKGVSESLAGRVGILDMNAISLREVTKNLVHKPFIPKKIQSSKIQDLSKSVDLWKHIQRGSMPELIDDEIDWQAYFSSYVRTYIERDVRNLINVRDEGAFFKFMIACAARTGQLLNMSDIANDIDVDVKTVRGWLSALEASGIILLLKPFWVNATKRLTKSPKLYFMDTGLACYLGAWNTPESLKRGAMAGHIFETFVVSEIVKSFMNCGADLRQLSFYRDERKREIDLIISDGHTLHPVEIKTSSNPSKSDIKNFEVLSKFGDYDVGFGSVICQAQKPFLISPNVQAISVFDI